MHAYVGVLIAPTVLFFAATGILQVYNLHEARGDYVPPPALEALGRLHKDQVLAARHRDGERVTHAASEPRRRPPDAESHRTKPAVLVLKAFVTSVAIGLIFSVLVGLWIALQPGPRRRIHVALLLAGVVIPALLVVMTGQ